jgi:hypothetical protein
MSQTFQFFIMPRFSCIITECRKAVPVSQGMREAFSTGSHHQRAQGEGKRHGETDVAEVEHRGMDDHLRILQQRIQTEAVGGNSALHQREGRRGEVEQQQKEDLHAGKDGGGVGAEPDVHLVPSAEHKAVRTEQPGPQQQRSFLAGPERSELVCARKCAVGMMEDVGDRKVVGECSPDQCECSSRGGEEAGDAGAAGGLGQTLGRDAGARANCQLTLCNAASQQSVGTECEGEKEGEATKDWHSRPCVDCRKARRDAPIRKWMVR